MAKFLEVSPCKQFVRSSEIIGEGAFKLVYKAFDAETGRNVAWNVVDLRGKTDKQKKALRLEIELLRKFADEPTILTLYHAWETKTEIVFLTELFSTDLFAYARENPFLRVRHIKKFFLSILRALTVIQAAGYVHKDVKPHNFFLNSSTKRIVLGDLGSVELLATELKSSQGTAAYLAPEVFEGKYDGKADIYSFGMSFLSVLERILPYKEFSNPAQLWKALILSHHPPLILEAKWIPPSVRSFVELCISPDPSNRPSATELLAHPFWEATEGNELLLQGRVEPSLETDLETEEDLLELMATLETKE